MSRNIKVAIITVSDRCFSGIIDDFSGQYLKSYFEANKLKVSFSTIIQDNLNKITQVCLFLSDFLSYDIVILTGGTGISDRDLTPEALKKILTKEIPGIQIALISNSLKYTKFAPLSRSISGIRNKTLFISLPGNPKACKECMEIVYPLLEHAVNLIQDEKNKIEKEHFHNLDLKEPTLENRYQDLVFNKDKIEINSVLTVIFDVIDEKKKEKKNIFITDETSYGHYTVNDISSKINLPPFRASLKDGYAISTNETRQIKQIMELPIYAGVDVSKILPLKPDHCYRINTGAWVPDDADAVIKIEDTEIFKKFDDKYFIKINIIPKKNSDIKEIGSDVMSGDLILPGNSYLDSASLGLLASVGINQVEVYEKPKIGILSTGDELLDINEEWKMPYIYDSNRTILKNLLFNKGFYVSDLGIAKDDMKNLYFSLILAFEKCDILITSGSISVGEKDYLKSILLNNFNSKIHFSRVNIKPGMPFTFISCMYKEKIKYVFALPGNPVSTYVITKLFVIPSLKVYCGRKYIRNNETNEYDLFKVHDYIKVYLSNKNDFQKFCNDDRPEFVRCRIDFENTLNNIPVAYLVDQIQLSSKIQSIQKANALVFLKKQSFQNNEIFNAILIN